jgi:glycosyltransferase involved in cell wall biosynthesis
MRDEMIARGVPAAKIVVVPNAVDVNAFVPTARNAELGRRLGIEAGEVVLGYISSFSTYEGITYLLEAIARLVAAGHRVRGLLVGDGLELPNLTRQAGQLNLAEQVIFTGRVPHAEVLDYYGLIDIFVVPRTADRVSHMVTPLKPYEAMATGRAVVVSGVDALREMVVPGETGLIFDAENAEHLAAVVIPLIEDPSRRATLGRAARDWVCANRTWEQNARRYAALYRDMGIELSSDVT